MIIGSLLIWSSENFKRKSAFRMAASFNGDDGIGASFNRNDRMTTRPGDVSTSDHIKGNERTLKNTIKKKKNIAVEIEKKCV